MPKTGYTGITLKSDVAALLRERARKAGLGLNEFLLTLLGQSHNSPRRARFKVFLVRPPGFEPGSSAWQADVLTRLDYGRFLLAN